MLFTIINYISWAFTAIVLLCTILGYIFIVIAKLTKSKQDDQYASKISTFFATIGSLYLKFGIDCTKATRQAIKEIITLIRKQ